MTRTDHRVVVVTGAAGFLGSAITVDLARDYRVIAIDVREPSQALRDSAPTVAWHQVDICNQGALTAVFQETRRRLGRIDFVLHFAAFYHFGTDWHPEYQRTNVEGTSAVLRAAKEYGVERLIFASSMVAMLPPPQGKMLTERSPTSHYIPYGKSKSIGEELVEEGSPKLSATVLRIAGVFSDWCELPPLDSLIRLWAGNSPLNRIIAGRGGTGIPYIHRDDLVRLVRICIDRNAEMASYEVFLASQYGAVSHREIFQLIHSVRSDGSHVRPVFLPRTAATVGVHLRRALGFVTRNPPYERPWMLKYIDRPWIADTSFTRDRLDWDCMDGMKLCDRLPTMINRFLQNRRVWNQRSRARNDARYSYMPEKE
jgi:nucleoside-diphosphate-sugar epimerase